MSDTVEVVAGGTHNFQFKCDECERHLWRDTLSGKFFCGTEGCPEWLREVSR